MKKEKFVPFVLIGIGGLAIGIGYLLGRTIIRWQDRNDPPVTAINE